MVAPDRVLLAACALGVTVTTVACGTSQGTPVAPPPAPPAEREMPQPPTTRKPHPTTTTSALPVPRPTDLPDALSPVHLDGALAPAGSIIYVDGSEEARFAAETALTDLGPVLRHELFTDPGLTARVAANGPLTTLTTATVPEYVAHDDGAYLSGPHQVLVAVDSDEPPELEKYQAAQTLEHELLHALDDKLGATQEPGSYYSDGPAFQSLARRLPETVWQSLRAAGYPDADIPSEIFAKSGAAWTFSRADTPEDQVAFIGAELTQNVAAFPADVRSAGLAMDEFWEDFEAALAVQQRQDRAAARRLRPPSAPRTDRQVAGMAWSEHRPASSQGRRTAVSARR